MIVISDKLNGGKPVYRYSEWEGVKREYIAQDAIFKASEFETYIIELRIPSIEQAYPPGEYTLCLSSFDAKGINNLKGDVPSHKVNRLDFKPSGLRLVPVKPQNQKVA